MVNENFLKSLDPKTRLHLGGALTPGEAEEMMDYTEKLEEDQVKEDGLADKLDALRGAVREALAMLEAGEDRDVMSKHLEKVLGEAW
jgi:hypothetical protein